VTAAVHLRTDLTRKFEHDRLHLLKYRVYPRQPCICEPLQRTTIRRDKRFIIFIWTDLCLFQTIHLIKKGAPGREKSPVGGPHDRPQTPGNRRFVFFFIFLKKKA